MELQDFIDENAIYEKEGVREPAFWEARDNLGNYLAYQLDPIKLKNIIVPFLGKWSSYRARIDWHKLAGVWTPNLQRIARGLSNERLEDSEDETLVETNTLYNCLREVQGIGATNASKLLSLSLPELCTMWDKRIKEMFERDYPSRPRTTGGRATDYSTYLRFLRKQSDLANSLIEQYMHNRSVGKDEAVKWLRQIPLRVPGSIAMREKPIAKLLDQYNYTKRR